jgi:acyl-CoA dehydrogenase
MDLGPSARASEYLSRVTTFMDDHVYPAEPTYAQQRRTLTEQGTPHHLPPVVEELKEVARSQFVLWCWCWCRTNSIGCSC